MGKSGDLLRAKKAAAKIYHFSAAELEQHDRDQTRRAIELYERELKRREKERYDEANASIIAEWERRADEFATDDRNENFMNALAYMFAIPCRVLIEGFGWKPVRKDRRETRIERFATLMIEEMNRITDTEQKDIRTYARETFELYGLKFVSDFVFTEGNDDNVHGKES